MPLGLDRAAQNRLLVLSPGLRRILVPPHLGYGARSARLGLGDGAILEFELELLQIGPTP